MTREELLAYCLAKPGAWPDEPWDGDVVAKVGPKIFAFTGEDLRRCFSNPRKPLKTLISHVIKGSRRGRPGSCHVSA